MNDGFLSVVADKANATRLMVRARRRVDLENIAGKNAEIVETPVSDYRWRTFLQREDFAKIVADRIEEISYTNFKDSVPTGDLHDLYLGFWQDHYRYGKSDPTLPKKGKPDRSGHLAWGPNDLQKVDDPNRPTPQPVDERQDKLF